MHHEPATRTNSIWWSASLVLVGLCFVIFAKDIGRTGTASHHDLGPRAFPLALSSVLIAGGLIHGVVTLVQKRRTAGPSERPGGDWRQVAVTLTVLLIYLLAVPWLGLIVCTFPFAVFLMVWFGARLSRAVLATAVMLLFVWLLFERFFEVQLPGGSLWG